MTKPLFSITLILTMAACHHNIEYIESHTKYSEKYEEVFAAIVHVESRGDPGAQNGDQVGVAQIRPILVHDLNKHGYNFTLEDRWCPEASFDMFRAYTQLYEAWTTEDMARLWNGGPSMNGTDNYWRLVEDAISFSGPS